MTTTQREVFEISPPEPNHEAERGVIGSIMLDPAALADIKDPLSPRDFASKRPGRFYAAACAIARRGERPLPEAMRIQLQTDGCWWESDLLPLLEIAEAVPSAKSIDTFAKAVKENARARAAFDAAREAQRMISSGEYDAGSLDALIGELKALRNGGSAVVTTRLADIAPQPISWLWPGRIACGKLTLIAGAPGLGKSIATLDFAARVSRGEGWPGNPAATSEPGGVVLLSAEDDLADTVRPRLDAIGADVERIAALTTPKAYNPDTGREEYTPFNLKDGLPMLERAIAEVKACRLVVIDPVSAYLGNTDSHNNSEVRGVLAPLADLAARCGIAVITVSHLNKGGGDALTRVQGNIGFVAAARSAFIVIKDKADSGRRLFLPCKNNLGADDTGFAYRVVGNGAPKVEWETAPVAISADEAVAPDLHQRGPTPEACKEAEAWLRAVLSQGPRPAAELLSEAVADGITEGTLRRAKDALGIKVKKAGYQGQWMWILLSAQEHER